MDLSAKIASELTIYSKYARHLTKENRRESWDEIVDRYEDMMLRKYCAGKLMSDLAITITEACDAVRRKEILPSMRGLQFAGPAIERNNSRIYNCSYRAATSPDFFREVMFLLLGGSGVGYSVQARHISQLPAITAPGKPKKFLVTDSIEGWADAVKALTRAFFKGTYLPRFDFSDIRKKGTILKTAGGRAPGPGPLRLCLDQILGVLENKQVGSKLTSTEVSDLACYIAGAVLSGGIRRSAMICLFDIDDAEMLAYKAGSFWELHSERYMVNVSAVAFRQDVIETKPYIAGVVNVSHCIAQATTEEQFKKFWKATEASRSGEPGIYWTNHPDWGTNPCCEIALKDKQFCNLTTIAFGTVGTQDDFNRRVRLAAILGTLQAGFVDMHYLGAEWESNCREEALLGISLTGIADNPNYAQFNFEEAANIAKETNEEIAKAIGINPAARITCIKPEGTASLVVGSSSGVHGRHAPYYIRRTRHNAEEPLLGYLARTIPALVVQDQSKPGGFILELPQRSPEGSITRDELALATLERLKFFRQHWVEPGHRSGVNTHNVSCTVSVRDHEWEAVGRWMFKNRAFYNGIAVLPYDGGSYVQAPFEDCTEETFNKMFSLLKDIDLSQVVEEEDNTALVENVACAGNQCELPNG
jgi:ribonucleoside-triphosphate reductase (thioredoxin)